MSNFLMEKYFQENIFEEEAFTFSKRSNVAKFPLDIIYKTH